MPCLTQSPSQSMLTRCCSPHVPLVIALAAALAASLACSDAAPVQPGQPPAAVDTTPPRFDLHVILDSDTTGHVEGTITDDQQVAFAEWGVVNPDGPATRDTFAITPGRQVSVRFTLPPRPWGVFEVGVDARDAAGHLAIWTSSWAPGPRTLAMTLADLPPAGPLAQPGLEFATVVRGPAGISAVTVLVDSGTAAERRLMVPSAWFVGTPPPYAQPRRIQLLVPPVLADGHHDFTVVVTDSAGATVSSRFGYDVQVPRVHYRVAPLGPLGPLGTSDVDAHALDLNAAGDVAGETVDADGRTHAVLWRGGVARALATGDSGASSATALNDAGDVAGFATLGGVRTAVAWPAGGAVVPLRLPLPGSALTRVVEVTDAHVVFGATPTDGSVVGYQLGSGTAIYYQARNILAAVNQRGQWVATYTNGAGEIDASPGLHLVPPTVRPADFFARAQSVALDAAGDVLGIIGGEPFLADPAGGARRLTAVLPGTPIALSPAGEALSFAGPDSVFVWSRRSGLRRIVVDDPRWTVDTVVRLNDTDVIAAHATDVRTGRRAAVILQPVGAP